MGGCAIKKGQNKIQKLGKRYGWSWISGFYFFKKLKCAGKVSRFS
jgi:hypothetical protein